VIRHTGSTQGRDGIAAIPGFNGRAMADRCYRSSSARGESRMSSGYHPTADQDDHAAAAA